MYRTKITKFNIHF